MKPSTIFIIRTCVIALVLCASTHLPAYSQQVEEDNRWSNEFGEHIEFNEHIRSVVVSDDHMYAKGSFTRVGGAFAKGLARWDGERWLPMTGGVCPDEEDLLTASHYCVFGAIAASGERVYASARYTLMGSDEEKGGLLLWDGDGWSEVFEWFPTTLSGVSSMTFMGSDLYLAGYFEFETNELSRERINGVIKWNGQTWEEIGDMGPSLVSRILWMASAHGYLYVSGSFFSQINDIEIPTDFARWDGQTWEAVGTMRISNVANVQAIDGDVYVSGIVRDADNNAMNNLGVAMWDGSSWHFYDQPEVRGAAFSIAKVNSTLYAQGTFLGDGLGPSGHTFVKVIERKNETWVPVRGLSTHTQRLTEGITQWNNELVVFSGINVEVLGGDGFRAVDSPNNGLNGSVRDMAVKDGRLFVAGDFNTVAGQPSVGIAEWDGRRWISSGTTFNGWINHVAASSDAVYAVGDQFVHPYASEVNGQPLQTIAELKDNTWRPLPGRFKTSADDTAGNGRIHAMEVFEDRLYVSGVFSLIDDLPVPGIAMWDGTEWASLGSEYNIGLGVLAMEYADNILYVGGRFATGPNAPGNAIAKWDGTNWSAVGNDDFPDSYISDLLFAEGVLYATGKDSLYQWDGASWESITRLAGNWATMQFRDSSLFVGSNLVFTSDTLQVQEDCRYVFSSIVEINNGLSSSLGSSTWRCQPPNFFEFWGNDREVWASAIMDGHLYIGGNFTYAGGKPSNYIAKWRLSSVPVPNNEEIPQRTEVEFGTTFPNPFTERIRATYDLLVSSEIKVEVYDVLGRRVALLVNEQQTAGSHEFSWEPGSLPAGLYFLTLQTQEDRKVQKVMYIK